MSAYLIAQLIDVTAAGSPAPQIVAAQVTIVNADTPAQAAAKAAADPEQRALWGRVHVWDIANAQQYNVRATPNGVEVNPV